MVSSFKQNTDWVAVLASRINDRMAQQLMSSRVSSMTVGQLRGLDLITGEEAVKLNRSRSDFERFQSELRKLDR